MSPPGAQQSSRGYSSYSHVSSSKVISRETENLRHWNTVVYKPVQKELGRARRQIDYESEKSLKIVQKLKALIIDKVNKYFQPIEDRISAKQTKGRKYIESKRQNIYKEQVRVERLLREEETFKIDPSGFCEDTFLQKVERLKRDARRMTHDEAVISVECVEIKEIPERIDTFSRQIEDVLENVEPHELFDVEESEHHFKARVNTPPRTELASHQTHSTVHDAQQLRVTPHPPRSMSAPLKSRSLKNSRSKRSTLPSCTSCTVSVPTEMPLPLCSRSKENMVPEQPAYALSRRNGRMNNVSLKRLSPSHIPLGKFEPSHHTKLFNVKAAVGKPCVSVHPMEPSNMKQLEHPYGVGVLSNGTRVVVESGALKILVKDSEEVDRIIELYPQDEAKATGCCDVTVLANNDVIISDSQRKQLILVRDRDQHQEVFVQLENGTPKGITNDGQVLYVSMVDNVGVGCVEKVDINTQSVIGRIVLEAPAGRLALSATSRTRHACPKYIAINGRRELLVSDPLNGVIWFVETQTNMVRCLNNAVIKGLSRPEGVCWIKDSRFVVAALDAKCHQLLIVDVLNSGNTFDVINVFGHKGNGDNEFNSPEGMALSDHHLFVCDLINSRLQAIPISFLHDSSLV